MDRAIVEAVHKLEKKKQINKATIKPSSKMAFTEMFLVELSR